MKDRYVLVIDSGIGGLSIVKHFLGKRADVNLLYYPDLRNFPYGDKDEESIGGFLLNIYRELSRLYRIELVVIACNTASVSALHFLRKHVTIPVIGTVPAVKLAAKLSEKGRIGVIATETTVRLDYLAGLVRQFAADKEVIVRAAGSLVKAAENFYSGARLEEVFSAELSPFKSSGIDTLVLGCTHYSFLAEEIEEYFEGRVRIVDSREGVANRMLHLLPAQVCSNESKRILILNDSCELERYITFNKKLKIFDTIIEEKSWTEV